MLFQLMSLSLAASPAPHAHESHQSYAPESLYAGFIQFFEPDTLSVSSRLTSDSWHCGTGLLLAIRDQWDSFSPSQQEHMGPIARPVVGEPTEDTSADAAPPFAGSATETCFDKYPSRRPQWAGDGNNKIVTEHFSVEWDGDSISESKAQSWADSLELSWQVEFDDMGWKIPDGTDEYLLLAYVADYNYAGAVTAVEYCDGKDMPFIVAGKSSFSQGTWYQDMASHELNHASQFSYGMGHEFYFWESTATWIEEYIYPSHNAWSQYIAGYSDAPYLAINKSSQQEQDVFMHMYGMAILNFYMDEYLGGPEFVRELWEYSVDNGRNYDLWIGEVLEDFGYDWSEVYDGFIATNSVMDYAEQSYFPTVELADTVKEFPASGGRSGNKKPEGYGQNYVRIKTNKVPDDAPDLLFVFTGDDSVEWSVQLVSEVDDQVSDVVKVSVVEGSGEAVVPGLAQYDRVYMVASPLTTKSKSYSYTWEMSTFDSDPEPVDTGDGGQVDAEVGGCACSTQPTNGSLPWLPAMLVALAPWIRRRKMD
jgi:MYXO-CTERM domain-containing protein